MARRSRYGKVLAFAVFPLAIGACGLSSEGSSDVDVQDAHTTPSGANTAQRDASLPESPDTDASQGATTDSNAKSDAGDDDNEPDAAIADTSTRPDVVLAPDANTNAPPNVCDVDRDGHLAKTTGCGGDDCCDVDGRAFPGQTGFFAQPDACDTFDYDCDGKAEPEFARDACKLGFLTCSGDGFALDTACGTQGDFVHCSFVPIFCAQTKSTRTQQCH